jgi:hypothetical protein
MNQTMFDVPDTLIVHVLSSHISLCILISASLILGILSVTGYVLMIPPL